MFNTDDAAMSLHVWHQHSSVQFWHLTQHKLMLLIKDDGWMLLTMHPEALRH